MNTVVFTIETVECASCGIPFGMTQGFLQRLRENGDDFHCPKGHVNVFWKSEVQKLRDELAREKHTREQAQAAKTQAERSRDLWIEESNKKAKKLAALKKRVANGVCPCCHRSVSQLRRHMETKHPKYIKATHGVTHA